MKRPSIFSFISRVLTRRNASETSRAPEATPALAVNDIPPAQHPEVLQLISVLKSQDFAFGRGDAAAKAFSAATRAAEGEVAGCDAHKAMPNGDRYVVGIVRQGDRDIRNYHVVQLVVPFLIDADHKPEIKSIPLTDFDVEIKQQNVQDFFEKLAPTPLPSGVIKPYGRMLAVVL